MKVLVLGGSSFSGRAFIEHCLSKGDEIADLSRPKHDINFWLPAAAKRYVKAGYHYVANFIALNIVAESWDRAVDYYQTNVVGLSRLVEELADSGLACFLQVSTPEVYGTTGTFLKEGARFNPSTPYAVSRAAGDMHLAVMHRIKGFPVVFTRTVNVYGPGQQLYRIIPKTALCALKGEKLPLEGGGVSTRSFIHIRDAVAGYRRVLEAGRTGETYHLATPRQTAICDLVAMVCDRAGVTFSQVAEAAPERPGKDLAYQLDDGKVRAELGWSDTMGLEAGIEEVVGWVRRDVLPRQPAHRLRLA